jgi:hypothetical protein
VDGLVPTGSDVWWFKDSNWAQPSISHLRRLMRRVVTNPQVKKEKKRKEKKRKEKKRKEKKRKEKKN